MGKYLPAILAVIAILISGVVVFAVVGRGSDDVRIDKITVEGTTCVVIRDNAGRAKFITCDWEG